MSSRRRHSDGGWAIWGLVGLMVLGVGLGAQILVYAVRGVWRAIWRTR